MSTSTNSPQTNRINNDALVRQAFVDCNQLPQNEKIKFMDNIELEPKQSNFASFVLAQINSQPGNLALNATAIGWQIKLAEKLKQDCIIFPELALMGYPIGDVITRFPFLVAENIKWLTQLAKQTKHTTALVGFVEPVSPLPINDYTNLQFYNSVAVLQDGKIQRIIRKALLPNYNEFYDSRTFKIPALIAVREIGSQEVTEPIIKIRHQTVGISICEDIWNDADFFSTQRYPNNPIQQLAALKPDLLINLSASPSRSRKAALKQTMLSHVAKKYQMPVLYINRVGAVDEISFDGSSMVFNPTGEVIKKGARFKEDWLIVDGEFNLTELNPTTISSIPNAAEKIFDPDSPEDLPRTYQTLVQGIKDYFDKTGFTKALLGLSGGLDSSVVVTLLADALGADNVLGVKMPSNLTSEESDEDAERLINNLGIHSIELPINQPVSEFLNLIEPAVKQLNNNWATKNSRSFAHDNVQAMSRATLLRLLGNEFNALPIATSDKSELYLGYATVNGDMSGGLAPLGDVPKTKVRQLAYWMNDHRPTKNAIPVSVMKKPPGAELAINPDTGKTLTAEEALMPYEFCDEIIWRIEALHQSYSDMINTEFFFEKNKPLHLEQKKTWLDRFFKRMSSAVFKWWLLPPAIIVEGNGSITKTDYRHPITANNICWQGHSQAEIESLLK